MSRVTAFFRDVTLPEVGANLATLGLTLAAVFGLSRLFTGPGRFFVPVAVVAVSVHAVCWLCRRTGVGLPPAAAFVVVTTALLTSWLVFLSTTFYGVPTRDTVHAARLALSGAADIYRTVAAPAPVVPGFTLAASVGAAAAAFLGDWAAFRMRATIEACLPSFSLFVLSAALAQGRAQVSAGVVFLGAVLLFLLLRHAAVDTPPSAWFASRSPGHVGSRGVLVRGLGLGAAVVAFGALVGPQLPGATAHALVNWRHRNTGDSSREIGISPLVDITARLQSQNHAEVFTVASSRPEYWRLTSLDQFNGRGWALRNTFAPVSGRLSPDPGPSTPVSATVRISALSSIWLPAPYRPSQVSGVRGISASVESGSLITDRTTSNNMTYTVVSHVPATSRPALASASVDPSLTSDLELPPLSPQIAQIARTVTRNAPTPYAKALALQDWLRGPTFRYDLNVPPDDSPSALLNFLTITRAGFCQQFAAAYAVLARSLGLPTRVAVGFTPGTQGSDGLYHVTDAQAHAWPEVNFAGIGWIAFEPTPGRGSPDPVSEQLTGVPAAQDTSGQPAATAPSPSVTAPSSTPPSPTPSVAPRDQASPVVAAPHHPATVTVPLLGWKVHVTTIAAVAGGGVGAAVLWMVAINLPLWLIGRRRRARASTPGEIVDLAWVSALESMAAAGVPHRRSETPAEYATRVGSPPLAELASVVEVADYSPSGCSSTDAQSAQAACALLDRDLARDRTWRSSVTRLADPRRVLTTFRSGR